MASIRTMTEADWPQVAEIYREGIETGNATFETVVPMYDKWDAAHARECRIVACMGEKIIAGWAALSPVSSRHVYAGVAEVSVYVGEKCRRQNIGQMLLNALIETSEKRGYWMLQSSIFEGNAASVAVHHKCGFRTVGFRECIGRDKFGKWHNTLLLERRSARVGLG